MKPRSNFFNFGFFPLKSALVLALGLSGGAAFAAATATDTASNYAPSSWNTSPANLGTGFGAWNITLNNAFTPPYVGTFLDTGSSVTSGGYAWATYANGSPGNGQITLSRAFTSGGGSASLINQTFSFELSSGGVGPGQGLLSAAIGSAFLFSYDGSGADNFNLSVGGAGPVATTVNFSQLSAGLLVSLTVSGALGAGENYTFSVSPAAGGGPLYSTSGTFNGATYDTSSFTYVDQNTTGNGFLNNLTIAAPVPEPSTLAICGLSGMVTFFIIRRRR